MIFNAILIIATSVTSVVAVREIILYFREAGK